MRGLTLAVRALACSPLIAVIPPLPRTCPPVMKNTLIVTSRPRKAGGAASAINLRWAWVGPRSLRAGATGLQNE